MMLGSRFGVGGELPRGISAELEAQLRGVEESLSEEERSSLRWTLTWLEGRPVLTLDNGVQLGNTGYGEG
jgi:hypothetical protein